MHGDIFELTEPHIVRLNLLPHGSQPGTLGTSSLTALTRTRRRRFHKLELEFSPLVRVCQYHKKEGFFPVGGSRPNIPKDKMRSRIGVASQQKARIVGDGADSNTYYVSSPQTLHTDALDSMHLSSVEVERVLCDRPGVSFRFFIRVFMAYMGRPLNLPFYSSNYSHTILVTE